MAPFYNRLGCAAGISVETQTDPDVIQLSASDPDTVDSDQLRFQIVDTRTQFIGADGFVIQKNWTSAGSDLESGGGFRLQGLDILTAKRVTTLKRAPFWQNFCSVLGEFGK